MAEKEIRVEVNQFTNHRDGRRKTGVVIYVNGHPDIDFELPSRAEPGQIARFLRECGMDSLEDAEETGSRLRKGEGEIFLKAAGKVPGL